MKRKRQGNLFFSLATVMALPIFVLGVLLVLIGKNSVSEIVTIEIKNALAATARESLDLYRIAYPGEIHMEDGRFYMGETDLTDDFILADRIKENTGLDITVFAGDTRIITTIRGKDGERIVGSSLEDERIIDAVYLGNEFYSSKVQIWDDSYFGYYIPIYSGEEVCGMLFAGMTNKNVASEIKTVVAKIMLVVLITLLAVLAIASVFARNIVRRLDQIRGYIGGLAENNFNEKMSETVLKKNDEIGEMGRYAIEVGRKIQTLIANDPLTGLLNRRSGRIELEKAVDKAELEARSDVTIALGDIDFFKNVNDCYGHECGDVVLIAISEVFKKHMKEKGFSIRWGGEEFLLVYQEDIKTAYEQLKEVAEEIRRLPFCYEENEFYVTMTFGISPYEKGDSIARLVKKADDLLYRGKKEGRNRIVI